MIDRSALVEHVKRGWLPLPRSIVPPERPFFLWETLPAPRSLPSDFPLELLEKLVNNPYKIPYKQALREAFERTLEDVYEVAV